MAHFEMLDETREIFGRTLHRIRATEDVSYYVNKGDIGGWIEKPENLSGRGWVFGDACVLDDALVTDDATVSGEAQILNSARIKDRASVQNRATVYHNVEISGRARVANDASLYENARVSGYAAVLGQTHIYGDAVITENARVTGNAEVDRNAYIGGNAHIFHDMHVSANAYIVAEQDVFTLGPIGSESVRVTLYRTRDGHVLRVGCWGGTVDGLAEEVEYRAGSVWWRGNADDRDRWKAEYAALEPLVRARIAGWKPVEGQ
ncbi:hypothetical protein [Nocardia gipuzkoensis]